MASNGSNASTTAPEVPRLAPVVEEVAPPVPENHSHSLLTPIDLSSWYLNKEFSDVKLIVGKGTVPEGIDGPFEIDYDTSLEEIAEYDVVEIPAHRIILARMSPYFKAMLTGQMEEAKSGTVRLPDSPLIFTLLLRCMYSNNFDIAIEHAVPILQLCDKYQVTEMVGVVQEFVRDHVDTVDGACYIGSDLIRCKNQFQGLLNRALDTLVNYFPEFVQLGFGRASRQLLVAVLEREKASRNFRAVSAVQLFQGLMSWADQNFETKYRNSPQKSVEARREQLKGLLPFVRFEQMTPSQLVDIVEVTKLLPNDVLLKLLIKSVQENSKVVKIMEFIGTSQYRHPFKNPHSSLELTVTASSTNDEPLSGVVGLEPANFWTDHDEDAENGVDPYVEVNFQGRRIIPRSYQFSVRAPCVPMRNWALEGYCETTDSWDVLRTHENDDSFPEFDEESSTCSWELPYSNKSYRKVRVRCTGPNHDDFCDVCLCCLEFRGMVIQGDT